jgi:surfeit locus 1 family protein
MVELVGRLRLDTSLPQGSFFALPTSGDGLVSKWNAQNAVETEPYYLDLQSGSWLSSIKVPAQLPDLSDGPHMAYALQWVFFAGLVGYGRILIRRSR